MKAILKCVANAIAFVLVSPALLLYFPMKLSFGPERAFPGWSQFFSLLPGTVGVYLRRAFYYCTLKHCALNCWIGFGTVFAQTDAEVGSNAYVGDFCSLGGVIIGDDVLVASHVSIMNGASQHGIERLDVPIHSQPGNPIVVSIGEDSWIGERCVIFADVGKKCVIGAGSVVAKPIADYVIAVGSPARMVRYRNGAPIEENRSEETKSSTKDVRSS